MGEARVTVQLLRRVVLVDLFIQRKRVFKNSVREVSRLEI